MAVRQDDYKRRKQMKLFSNLFSSSKGTDKSSIDSENESKEESFEAKVDRAEQEMGDSVGAFKAFVVKYFEFDRRNVRRFINALLGASKHIVSDVVDLAVGFLRDLQSPKAIPYVAEVFKHTPRLALGFYEVYSTYNPIIRALAAYTQDQMNQIPGSTAEQLKKCMALVDANESMFDENQRKFLNEHLKEFIGIHSDQNESTPEQIAKGIMTTRIKEGRFDLSAGYEAYQKEYTKLVDSYRLERERTNASNDYFRIAHLNDEDALKKFFDDAEANRELKVPCRPAAEAKQELPDDLS
jgi:hypothetical protein